MEKVIESIKVWDDLIDSLKKKKSKKICKYIFQKGKKSGQNCPIHIDEKHMNITNIVVNIANIITSKSTMIYLSK